MVKDQEKSKKEYESRKRLKNKPNTWKGTDDQYLRYLDEKKYMEDYGDKVTFKQWQDWEDAWKKYPDRVVTNF